MICPSCRTVVQPGASTCPVCRAPVGQQSNTSKTVPASLLELALRAAAGFGVDTSSPAGAAQSLFRLYQDAKANERRWTSPDAPDTAAGDFWRPGTTKQADQKQASALFDQWLQQANQLLEQRAGQFQDLRNETLQRVVGAWWNRRR